MGISRKRPIGIYYEHPDWFRPLFDELERRDLPFDKIHAASHSYDPTVAAPAYSIVLNRMSPSAYLRGAGHSIFYTLNYLAHLKRSGVRVINGYDSFVIETSKAIQLSLLKGLGLPYPRSRIINDPAEAPEAADGLRFPVVVKPNIGGSGAGVRRFDTLDALDRAVTDDVLDLGIDHTALVQEFIPADQGRIVRVEVLGARVLYAIRIYMGNGSFNLCPADVCQTTDGERLERAACPADAVQNDLKVEAYVPPRHVVEEAEAIIQAAEIEVGGVEYLVDERDGQTYFYDINAMSNFVADAEIVLGFDPFSKLVDYIEREAE